MTLLHQSLQRRARTGAGLRGTGDLYDRLS